MSSFSDNLESGDHDVAAGDQAFALLVQRVGCPIRDTVPPHVTVASADAIRHFARAYGDGNPLYSDPVYATESTRKGLCAPPLFGLATGTPRPSADPEDVVDMDQVPGGKAQTILLDRWALTRPIWEGTRLDRDKVLLDAAVESDSGGPTCVVTERTVYSADDVVYAVRDRSRRFRLGPVAKPAVVPVQRTQYSPEYLAEIERAYDTESRRGAEPLHIEDVSVGDHLGPLVKGPLTVTDLVEYRSGVGPGPLGGEALALAHANRRQRPELYASDAWGVPDIIERRHWDEKFAESLGLLSATDYSHTRMTWFSHLVTNWMGDGGWLRELSGVTNLGTNYVGDTHWLEGEVVAISDRGPIGEAELALSGRNQRSELTCRANAVVVLPKRPATSVTEQDLEAFPGHAGVVV
jgi:acyl dehydratase